MIWGRAPFPIRQRTAFVAVALAAALAILGSACGSSGFAYVASSDHRAYFKIPDAWHFFDKRDLLVASGQSLSEASNQQIHWLIGYDADPHPEVAHIVGLADPLKYPAVMAQVQTLAPQVRDTFSLQTIRNLVYPVDQLVQANKGEVLAYKEIVLPGGLHGSQMTFDVVLGGVSTVESGNDVIRVEQTAVVDPATNTAYVFFIRCESHCFRDNGSLITQIADSWTVKER
jgi:hypothetical protein